MTGTATSAAISAAVEATVSARTPSDETALVAIGAANEACRVWTVVLDDDPTGTQTVRDVPVLMQSCTEDDLSWAAEQPGRTTFVLTNSRSADEESAETMTFEVVRRAALIAERKNLTIRVISRSDSTLRGHFAAEIAAAHRALRAAGVRSHGTVFVPAFLEAGRVTVDDTQWVKTPTGYTPAARTEFARDATFGYTEEHLPTWVAERIGEPGSAATSVSLEELRAADGIARVASRIAALGPDDVLIANAADSGDLEVLMLGLVEQERAGRRPVIRSGPSFVRLAAGQEPALPVTAAQASTRGAAGLVVVGSHTALTTAQFDTARDTHPLAAVELDAAAVVTDDPASRSGEIHRCAREVIDALDTGDVALYTSREVLTSGRDTPLLTSKAVADALVEVVSQVATTRELGFLVAKGGITSSDMAVRALGTHRAHVTGQMLPGTIPVWELLDGLAAGLTYVVFPGNVGATDALAAVLTKLKATE